MPTDIQLAQELRDVPASEGGLTEREWDAWRLSRVSRLSYRTIAMGLDLSVSTVRDRIRNADRKIERRRRGEVAA